MKFYYTFGTGSQFPYRGGWVEVNASDRNEADKKFRAYYPDYNDGILNCSSIFEENNPTVIEMLQKGNLGSFCHRVIGADDKSIYTGYKIKIRKDLDINKKYGGLNFCVDMAEHRGKDAFVLLCDNIESTDGSIKMYTLDICDKRWQWTEAMFE